MSAPLSGGLALLAQMVERQTALHDTIYTFLASGAVASEPERRGDMAVERHAGERISPKISYVRTLMRNASVSAIEPSNGGGLLCQPMLFPPGRLWFGSWPRVRLLSKWPTEENPSPQPTIGVVIPAYNAAPSITRAIDAILADLQAADRLVIIENGSTDDTWEILQHLYGYDDRVVLERESVADAAKARSTGVMRCGTDYIAFCDADDLWSCAKLAIIREILRRTRADMLLHPVLSIQNGLPVITGAAFVENKLPRYDTMLADLLVGNFIATSAFVVRRNLFCEPAFAPGLKQTQDYEAWCQLALRYPRPTFVYYDEPLAFYRHWGGLSHAVETRIANVSGIVRRYSKNLRAGPRLVVYVRNAVRVLWYALRLRRPKLVWRGLVSSPHPAIGIERK